MSGASATASRSGAIASSGLPALEQDLALELEEEGVVGSLFEQRVGLRWRFIGIGAEVVGIGAGIMRRDALVGFGILRDRPLGVDDSRSAWP